MAAWPPCWIVTHLVRVIAQIKLYCAPGATCVSVWFLLQLQHRGMAEIFVLLMSEQQRNVTSTLLLSPSLSPCMVPVSPTVSSSPNRVMVLSHQSKTTTRQRQDNDKTKVEPVHSYYAFHTRFVGPGVKGIIEMHRFNICLVIVLSLSLSGVKAPLHHLICKHEHLFVNVLPIFGGRGY